MKKLTKLAIAAALLGSVGTASAQSEISQMLDRSSQNVYAGAGTTGVLLGLALKPTDSNVVYRAEGSSFSLNEKFKEGSMDYAADFDMTSFKLGADIHPWRNDFKFSAGLAFVDANAKLRAQANGGTFNFNGNNYVAGPDDFVQGTIKFPSVMPYVGIGLSNMNKEESGLTYFLDVGVMYGKPEATFTVSPSLQNLNGVAEEEQEFKKSVEDLGIYPVLKSGIGWRF